MKILTDSLGSIIVESTGELWTAGKLSEEIENRTEILSSFGIGRGDKVLIAHGGTPEFFF